MKRALLLAVLSASCVWAQEKANVVYQTSGSVGQEKGDVIYQTSGSVGAAAFVGPADAVLGAPYSATLTNESVQTLPDGGRIVQSSTGTTARDSQGRTRQDMALPALGNLAAANAAHLIFIQDPVAQVSYTLNLREKTAQKMPAVPPLSFPGDAVAPADATAGTRVVTRGAAALPPPPDAMPGAMDVAAGPVFFQRQVFNTDAAHLTTEDLGTQTMEGVLVTGVRTTHTIPAGEIGNDKPIIIITEVWKSADLKTIVYSKRSDPRMGDTTFRLTNIVRAEPDPALFTVPADFKLVDAPQPIFYRTKQ
jgi:hypothetical protein